MTENVTPSDFELKYDGVDLKLIDPRAITDRGECIWLMERLDQISAHIAEQIEFSMIRDPSTGTYPHDPVWRVKANRALRGARSLRQAVQNRLGFLNRDGRQQSQLQFERTFIRIARELLPAGTFEQIMTKTRKETRPTQRDGDKPDEPA